MALARKKAIFLTSELPFPATGGGKIRDAQLVKLLLEHVEVEVLCFGDPEAPLPAGPEASRRGLRMARIRRDRAPVWRRAFSPLRPYVINGWSRNMARALAERAEPGSLLWVSRLAMGQYIPLAKSLGYRVVLDEHNVESHVLLAGAHTPLRLAQAHWLAAQCRRIEARLCEQADAVVATSDLDARRLRKLAPNAAMHVIPNCVDLHDYDTIRSRTGTTLFFPGTLSYQPNVEGLAWFARAVLPRLQRSLGTRLPRVVVAGANPSPALRARLERAGIELHASPPSILPYLGDAAIVFVPIRSGSGTRLKILEGMAAGRAVVSTGKGAEGLLLSPGYDVWIAESADGFASALARLIDSAALRAELGAHGVDTVSTRYDWRCSRPVVRGLLEFLSGGAR